ncbi:MAG: RDD family protein [Brevinema sp.]
MIKKVQALKLAPWWKRLLSYFVDQLFLFVLLVAFILGIYGNEFVELINSINNLTDTSAITENLSAFFTSSELEQLGTERQSMFYLAQIIQNKYSRSIFLLSQILSFMYFFLMWMGSGQTIGAMLLKIRVISPIGIRPPVISTITRVIAMKVGEMAWGLPFLITTNPLFKQRLHDSLSQTIVVEDFDLDEILNSIDELDNEEKSEDPQIQKDESSNEDK